MGFSLFLAFVLYMLVLLGIGAFAALFNRSSGDFHLGGRKINYWVTAISAHASDMSSWLFLAFPFSVYSFGLIQCWTPLGLIAGMWANWVLIAPRLRARSEELGSETIPDFLAKSVKDTSGVIKLISCSFCIFFFLFYIASGLKGVGFLLNSLFDISLASGIFLSAFVLIIYISLGGFFAISFVGAFQGIFLLLMLLLVPFAMKENIGESWLDFFSLAAKGFEQDPNTKSFFTFEGIPVALSWGLGYFGLVHVLSKFMGVDSVKSLRKSKWVGLVWQVLALGSSLSVGILAKAYFSSSDITENILFIRIVESGFVPFLAGLVFCAMLAATISTVDSQIMVSATSLTKDVFKLSGKSGVFVSRVSILLLTLLAATMASYSQSSIDELVRYAWVGQGCSFGPLVIATLYFKRLSSKHAAIGMLLGGLLCTLWPLTSLPFSSYPMIPGFSISLLYLFLTSKLSV